MILLTVSK